MVYNKMKKITNVLTLLISLFFPQYFVLKSVLQSLGLKCNEFYLPMEGVIEHVSTHEHPKLSTNVF